MNKQFVEKVKRAGSYDTKAYRYICAEGDKYIPTETAGYFVRTITISRIRIKDLGTTAALAPEIVYTETID